MAWTKKGTRLALAGYLLVVVVILAGLTWVTVLAVRLERADSAAQVERHRNQILHRTVGRLDERVHSILSRETSRDPREYSSVVTLEDPLYVVGGRPVFGEPEDMWLVVNGRLLHPQHVAYASPLVSEEIEPWVLGHFQVSDVSDWTSPQVTGRWWADPFRLASSPVASRAPGMLTSLRQRVTPQQLGQLVADAHGRGSRLLAPGGESGVSDFAQRRTLAEQTLGRPPAVCDWRDLELMAAAHTSAEQGRPDDAEEEKDCPSPADAPGDEDWEDEAEDDNTAALSSDAESNGGGVIWDPSTLTGIWLTLDDGPLPYLAFVRTVSSQEDQVVYQGFVVDWASLREELLETIGDLFPGASLVPLNSDSVDNPEAVMTHLPVRLDVSGCPLPESDTGWKPMHTGLLVAWAAALIVLIAAGIGVRGLITLAERRSQFAYAVSHELRTPLTTFRLYTDMLVDGLVPEESRDEYLKTLSTESHRLTQLVSGVLEYSQLEHHSVQPTLERVPVGELLNAARERFEPRCREADRQLVVEANDVGESECLTDVELTLQIVGTLIDNACKYAGDAADSRVILSAHNGRSGHVVLEVRDFGPGVPRKQRRSIFKPFRRGQSGATATSGIGLGLALAARWAGLLGAKLESIDTTSDEPGARFRVTLPR